MFVLRNEYGFYWAGGSWTAVLQDAKPLNEALLKDDAKKFKPLLNDCADCTRVPAEKKTIERVTKILKDFEAAFSSLKGSG